MRLRRTQKTRLTGNNAASITKAMHPKPFSRRDLGKLALAALPLSKVKAARVTSSTLSGVKIGVITGSFRRQLPPIAGADNLDTLIAAMSSIGLSHVELDPSYIKPG